MSDLEDRFPDEAAEAAWARQEEEPPAAALLLRGEAEIHADWHRIAYGDDVILHSPQDMGWAFVCEDCGWSLVYVDDDIEAEWDEMDGSP